MSQTIDIESLKSNRTTITYPNIFVSKPDDNLPVIIDALEPGDMEVIIEYNNRQRVIKRISRSALNVDRLIRAEGVIQYYTDADTCIDLYSILDYLEAL